MLIVDADVHISPVEEKGYISAEEAIRRMDEAGVERALCWLQPPFIRETDAGNEYVFQATRRWPRRIIGFGWANPRLGVEQAKDTVKKCIEEYGFAGVKMNGAQDDYVIDDPALAMPVIETIVATGKAPAFHSGADAPENTHPFRVGKIAAAFPETKILMVHMGGVGWDNLSRSAVEMALEHPNLFLIGSAVRSYPILNAIETLGPKRLCFGSDTPFEPMDVEVAKYKALLSHLPQSAQEQIFGRNILRILELKADQE